MPDIVTMAKGIAGGFPMGALVTTPGKTAPPQLPSLQKSPPSDCAHGGCLLELHVLFYKSRFSSRLQKSVWMFSCILTKI